MNYLSISVVVEVIKCITNEETYTAGLGEHGSLLLHTSPSLLCKMTELDKGSIMAQK